MRRSSLILLLVLLIDLLLLAIAGAMIWAIQNDMISTAIAEDQAIQRIVTILGIAAGVFTVIGLLSALIQRAGRD